MGKEAILEKTDFQIIEDNKQRALENIQDLMKNSDDFSYIKVENPQEWETLEEALKAWRFRVDKNKKGDIINLRFNSTKIGDEEQMFSAIASEVKEGSSLTFNLVNTSTKIEYIFLNNEVNCEPV